MLHEYSEWIIETLFSIGIGTSDKPASFSDIKGWIFFSGLNITFWEAKIITELAAVYINSLSRYKDPCPAPFESQDQTESRRQAISNLRRLQLRAFTNG